MKLSLHSVYHSQIRRCFVSEIKSTLYWLNQFINSFLNIKLNSADHSVVKCYFVILSIQFASHFKTIIIWVNIKLKENYAKLFSAYFCIGTKKNAIFQRIKKIKWTFIDNFIHFARTNSVTSLKMHSTALKCSEFGANLDEICIFVFLLCRTAFCMDKLKSWCDTYVCVRME